MLGASLSASCAPTTAASSVVSDEPERRLKKLPNVRYPTYGVNCTTSSLDSPITQPPLRAQRRGGRDERDDAQGDAGSVSHRFLQYEMSCAHTSRRRHASCPASPRICYAVDAAILAPGTVRHNRPRRCPRPETELSTHWLV